MLMAAATHVLGSAHSSSTSSSISPPPPPPWHPVVLIPSHHHHHHQYQQQNQLVLYDDLYLATPSPFPSPTTPAATASPPAHNHNHLRSAASRQRAAGKQPRRPRPSQKLPTTTYISADAASFRRMVHQVTGFDHDVPLLHLHGGGPVAAPGPEVLYRQTPHSRGAQTTTETMLLPTLDTSAFLMLGAAGRGGGAAPTQPAVSSCRHGSAAAAVDPGACGGRGDGGFPSLESWDEDDALFLEFASR